MITYDSEYYIYYHDLEVEDEELFLALSVYAPNDEGEYDDWGFEVCGDANAENYYCDESLDVINDLMTNDLIPDHIMDFYNKEEKMDKQNYKEMLAESIESVGQTAKEVNRLQLLVAKYKDESNHIWNLVKDTSNDS